MQATCGAVSGAVFLAGLKNSCGDLENPVSKGKSYQLSKKIVAAFQEKNGSIICAELLGAARPKHETAQPEARTAAYYQKRPCVGCVEDCAEIVEQYLCGTGKE